MDKFVIKGPCRLKGEVEISGSKNAALPILIASLLTDEPCLISRVPALRDIKTTFRLLESLGKKIEYTGNGRALIVKKGKHKTRAPYNLVKQMRASVLVAGPLLARFGRAVVPMPGGCAIGLRPVNIHLDGFKKLGAEIEYGEGNLTIVADKLKGARVKLSFPSVGATENLILCAVLACGKTIIEGPALEPEIDDLISCLNAMGADIKREKKAIVINGVKQLKGANYEVMPDRIETGTYLMAALMSGGNVKITDCVPSHISSVISALKKAGAKIETTDSVIIARADGRPRAGNIDTLPYPGFPTDLQAPYCALSAVSSGVSKIRERIFENRFMHIPELARMGANIDVKDNTAVIEGVPVLSGATVMASDLRGGAALVLAGLCACGTTMVDRVYHIDRGYERMEKKLRALGAKISRIKK